MEHVGRGVDLKGNGHNGDLNVTGNFRLRSFVPVCPQAIENSLPSRRMSLSHSVIFKLGSISPCPPLLGFGPHMSFISICRNCETFTTMDCDRFHKLNFTVAPGVGKRQCSPSVDCDCTRHFHKRLPYRHG